MVKYIDIVVDLKEKIENGKYPSWSTLEGEVNLANRYQTSRTTIRKALAVLKDEGYIHSRQGSGIYVNPPEFYKEQLLLTLSDRFEGPKLDSKVIFFEIIPATNKLKTLFNLDKDVEFIHYRRVRFLNQKPIAIEETWMPQSMVPEFKEAHLYRSVMNYLEQIYHISHDFKQISAIKLSANDASLLNRKTNELSLQIIHQVYLVRSILIQYTIEIQAENGLNALSVRSKL
jgi:DNA-binding GntR family transcriptional regulator